MQNMIKNAQWFSQENGKILYFTNEGSITYDRFCMDNHRFCSLTMKNDKAANRYECEIDLDYISMIRFGYHMRAIAAESVVLEVTFLDENRKKIKTCSQEISEDIGSEFHDVCAEFSVLRNAAYAKIGLCSNGDITALTFGMPFLELYEKA